MSIPKPTFNEMLANYPISAHDFGAGGRIVNNPQYEHTCALRFSTALERASPSILSEFGGNRAVHREGTAPHIRRTTLPYVRGSWVLANYLQRPYVGWAPRRLNTRRQAMHVGTQGFVFWKVKESSSSPNHIDLWDPSMKTLKQVGGRTMLWAPAADIVEYVWFWELERGGNYSPSHTPHSLQSGR